MSKEEKAVLKFDGKPAVIYTATCSVEGCETPAIVFPALFNQDQRSAEREMGEYFESKGWKKNEAGSRFCPSHGDLAK